MDAAAFLLALLRGAHVWALLSLFGALLFAAVITPAERAGEPHATAMHGGLIRLNAAVALLLGAAWLAVETATIAGVDNVQAIVGILPVVALHTQFGRFLLLRLALLLVVLLLPARRETRLLALLPAAAAIAIQPMFGHAGAATGRAGTTLIAAEVVHLLAAGAWLGGLLPLWFAVRRLPPALAARACTRFSMLGLAAVCLIVGTALVLATALVGSLPALVGTLYGRLVLLKSGLLLLALVLACRNRFVLTGRLAAVGKGARPALLRSVGIETAIGLAIVLAAAFLAAQMPGADYPAHAHLAGWLGVAPPRLAALAGLGAAGVGLAAGLLWLRGPDRKPHRPIAEPPAARVACQRGEP